MKNLNCLLLSESSLYIRESPYINVNFRPKVRCVGNVRRIQWIEKFTLPETLWDFQLQEEGFGLGLKDDRIPSTQQTSRKSKLSSLTKAIEVKYRAYNMKDKIKQIKPISWRKATGDKSRSDCKRSLLNFTVYRFPVDGILYIVGIQYISFSSVFWSNFS